MNDGPLAQSGSELRAHNAKVRGSNPRGSTNFRRSHENILS